MCNIDKAVSTKSCAEQVYNNLLAMDMVVVGGAILVITVILA